MDKIDLERSSNFISRRNPKNIENTKKIISQRIKQIVKKLDVSARIVIINCTWYDNLFSQEILNNVDCSVEIVKKSSLEEFLHHIDISISKKKYDIICCFEMLEHVDDPKEIIKECLSLLKPNGSFYMSTLNRNLKSFVSLIVGAEYLLNMVPKGTHSY